MKNDPCLPVFAHHPHDRMDCLREDINGLRLTSTSLAQDRYIVLDNNRLVLNQQSNLYTFCANQLPQALIEQDECVFLGSLDGRRYFALAQQTQELQGQTVHLRALVAEQKLPLEHLGLYAQANSLLNWHQRHRFCANCGNPSIPTYGGWRRDCSKCHAQHFPRTDPVVIMLVTHQDKCLLGRGHNFGGNRFSCLAGFMEPGETIAQAAGRELFEEAGIRAGEVSFLFDQPWPFPSNLMIGVHVQAMSTELTIDENELAEAIWVSREELAAAFAGKPNSRFELPLEIAIARNLLTYWMSQR